MFHVVLFLSKDFTDEYYCTEIVVLIEMVGGRFCGFDMN